MTTKSLNSEKICPRCGAAKMKKWHDLSDEGKFLAERLPASAEFTLEQRKKHRICERCWFEDFISEANQV